MLIAHQMSKEFFPLTDRIPSKKADGSVYCFILTMNVVCSVPNALSSFWIFSCVGRGVIF